MVNKKALLVVSFGTSNATTRRLTINECESKIKSEFVDYDFYMAWTSKMIIKKLKVETGEIIKFPDQMLEELYQNGYEEVLIQSLHIINGEEYDKIKYIYMDYKDKFKKLILGRPLLSSPKDYDEVTEIMGRIVEKDLGDNPDKTEAVVFMGHGTEHVAHTSYTGIEHRLKMASIPAYVGTVEGYPDIDIVIEQLRRDSIKKVHLRPFLLVAGVHANDDMAGDSEDSWKSMLEREGLEVIIHLEGLGENKDIQEKFLRNLKEEI